MCMYMSCVAGCFLGCGGWKWFYRWGSCWGEGEGFRDEYQLMFADAELLHLRVCVI